METKKVPEQSLATVLGKHLNGQISLGDVEKKIDAKFGPLGWRVTRPNLSKMRSGKTKTTQWQKLTAIAWALNLTVEQTNQLLGAAGKADLQYYYGLRDEHETVFFERWPELAGPGTGSGGAPAALPSDTQAGAPAIAPSAATHAEVKELVGSSRISLPMAALAAVLIAVSGGWLLAANINGSGDDVPSTEQTTVPDNVLAGPSTDPTSIALRPSYTTVSTAGIRAVSYSPDGALIAFGDEDGVARLWDPATEAPVGPELARHSGPIRGLAFSSDGTMLATASEDYRVGVWDVASGDLVTMITPAHEGIVRDVAFSPTGDQLASVGEDGTLRRWDPLSGDLIDEPTPADTDQTISVTYSPDGTEIATLGNHFQVRFWDSETGDPSRDSLPADSEWVRQVAYHPSKDQIATAGRDSTVRLYDGYDLTILRGHEDQLHALAYSPDGSLLASVGEDEAIWVWDTANGEELLGPVAAHRDPMSGVAFHPGGQQLVTVSRGGELALWTIEFDG